MEAKMRLREWLIAQIDSEQYEGLCWENEDKTMFRIPWKHAAKKDYNQDEDAALFKVNILNNLLYVAWTLYRVPSLLLTGGVPLVQLSNLF